MKKLLLTFLAISVILVSISFVSAALCQNSKGYYQDCGSNNRNSGYNTINSINPPTTPIFKGSYGNYRYVKYANGDYNPPRYFVSYGPSFSYPRFNYGYGGYGGYGGFGNSYYGGLGILGYRGYGGFGGLGGYSRFGGFGGFGYTYRSVGPTLYPFFY